MTRIAIIGNAGGGKSTLSRKLRDALGLPLHPIDLLQWQPGWKAVSRAEFATAHAALVVRPRWIIDGWGDFDLIEERFRRSDAIILRLSVVATLLVGNQAAVRVSFSSANRWSSGLPDDSDGAAPAEDALDG